MCVVDPVLFITSDPADLFWHVQINNNSFSDVPSSLLWRLPKRKWILLPIFCFQIVCLISDFAGSSLRSEHAAHFSCPWLDKEPRALVMASLFYRISRDVFLFVTFCDSLCVVRDGSKAMVGKHVTHVLWSNVCDLRSGQSHGVLACVTFLRLWELQFPWGQQGAGHGVGEAWVTAFHRNCEKSCCWRINLCSQSFEKAAVCILSA